MNDIFRQIAKENGTTEKAVKEEGKEPPIEKVIAMIALNVNNRMYN